MNRVKFGAEGWNNRFRGDDWAYGKEPNAWLAKRIKPGIGKALVPADGEGRNAVWIAAQGYETKVFDLSDVGKEKCAILSQEKGVTVEYEVDDLAERDFTLEEYDLIACSWFHVPWTIFCEHYPRMLSSLKPGGELLFKYADLEVKVSELLGLYPVKPWFGTVTQKGQNHKYWCWF